MDPLPSPRMAVRRQPSITWREGCTAQVATGDSTCPEHAYFASEVEPLLGRHVDYVGEVSDTAENELQVEASGLLNATEGLRPLRS